MSRRRTATTVAGAAVGAVASAGVASYLANRRSVPSWTGVRPLPGLAAQVEVARDNWGIPAIEATCEDDVFMAQGWLHASDRLFQMVLLRAVGRGELSAIVGAKALPGDRLSRVLGFHRHVEEEAGSCSPESRRVLEAYCRGVNAFIEQMGRRRPVELRLLRHRPRPWTPADCLISSRLMMLGLSGNWEAELARAEVAARFGDQALAAIDPDANVGAPLPQLDLAVLSDLAATAQALSEPFGGGPGTGSNNWVIGPRRTRSGGALLANDPHLDLGLPSIWYENLLRCPTYQVRGFSIAGTPGVVLGRNASIAWGFTNSSVDVQDCYLEQIDESAGTYLDTDGEQHPLEVRREVIEVRGRHADEELVVRSTRRGPLLGDAIDSGDLGAHISLRWHGNEPGTLVDALISLNRAENWDAFREAISLWTSPAQNVVYADRDGNIGYQHAGSVPIRAGHDGCLPRAGSDPDAEWTGVIPFDELPMAFNPAADVIVTANERIAPDDYPYWLGRDWMNHYRGQRIRQLIDSRDGHRVSDQVSIQCDVHSLPGTMLRDAIAGMDDRPAPASEAGRDVLDALLAWDGELDESGDGGIAYRLLIRSLQHEVFGFLGDVLPRFLGYSRTGMNGFWALYWRTVPRLVRDIAADDRSLLEAGAAAVAEQDGAVEWEPATNWSEMLARACDRAGIMWQGELPEDMRAEQATPQAGSRAGRTGASARSRRKRWHRLRLQHPLGVIPGIGLVASNGPFAVPGDPDTVWQASSFNNPINSYSMVGPSHRTVVDLAHPDESVAVIAGGQSGHPASPHYVDQVPLWRRGDARPAPWTAEGIERATRYRQYLDPA